MESGLWPLKLVPIVSESAEGAASYQPGATPQEMGIIKQRAESPLHLQFCDSLAGEPLADLPRACGASRNVRTRSDAWMAVVVKPMPTKAKFRNPCFALTKPLSG
jgi:hypothetical protein